MLVGPASGYDRAVSDAPCDVATYQGDWLSWLERAVHIREVTGSNPVSPTTPLSYLRHRHLRSVPVSWRARAYMAGPQNGTAPR